MPQPFSEWTWEPSKWLSSLHVRSFKDYQRGWYIQLINESMNGNSEWPAGHLPADEALCQELVGAKPTPTAFDAMPESLKRLVPAKVWAWHEEDFRRRWSDVWKLFKQSMQHPGFVVHPAVKEQLDKRVKTSGNNRVNGILSVASRKRRTGEWKEGGLELEQQMQDGAEAFWNLYPSCENKTNKLRCDEVFRVVIGTKWQEVLPAIERDIAYRLAHSWKDRRFVPKPENYLAERYWDAAAHEAPEPPATGPQSRNKDTAAGLNPGVNDYGVKAKRGGK